MNKFTLDKESARLIVLQRIELLQSFQKKLRKLFGRYIFSNYFLKFFVNTNQIGEKYFYIMKKEYETIENEVKFSNKKYLSIGGGLGGLELIINMETKNNFFYFIEKNYVSKKVKYGWDDKNLEAYNNLQLVEKFLTKNGMNINKFKIYDFDTNNFPNEKFDFIISLYSLDYHYDFNIYLEYLKKISNDQSKIIFDTIRADYFKNIFKNVKIIQSVDNTVHKSKRIICSEFI
tara:strand:- start:1845 stop:2540 length:696 start_codon:yes stop_codon:yes gene_type:complete